MRHRVAGRKLGHNSAHKRAMMRALATSLILEERITTTEAKAKELRPYIERLVTKAKAGTLQDRRLVARKVLDSDAVQKLFDTFAPRFKERQGGYTRIYKVGFRPGDNAPKSLIEFLPEEKAPEPKEEPKSKKKAKKVAEAE